MQVIAIVSMGPAKFQEISNIRISGAQFLN